MYKHTLIKEETLVKETLKSLKTHKFVGNNVRTRLSLGRETVPENKFYYESSIKSFRLSIIDIWIVIKAFGES